MVVLHSLVLFVDEPNVLHDEILGYLITTCDMTMAMTTSFLKKHRQIRRKTSSSTLGKNIVQSDKRSEKRTRIVKSDIRLPRPIRREEDYLYLPLSLQFPYPPLPTPSNPNFSPLSSPSSTSSGLPRTPPETSPSSSPLLKAQSKLAFITPLSISKSTDLTFGNFFSAPLSPTSSEETFDEPISPISPMMSFASPIYPLTSRAQDDPFIIIPPLTPLSEHDEDDEEPSRPTSDVESDDDYYTNALSSLLTLSSRMPQQNQHPSTRPESMLRAQCEISKLPNIPLDEETTGFEATRKACFPSAQLDPAWGRRSFLIPTRSPPPPPIAVTPESATSPASSPAQTLRPRPPSLKITKPFPRMSVVPLDTLEEDDVGDTSLLSYYGVSPSYGAFSSSSSSSSRASLGDFELQFEMDLESDLKFPVSLPGSPSDVEADEDGDDEWMASPTEEQLLVKQDQFEGSRDHTELDEKRPVHALRSRWSSSTLSSIHHLQSPRTPSTVSKFKHYLRGSINKKEGTSHRKGKRGVVVLGPSSSAFMSASPPTPFSPSAKSIRFANTPIPRSPSTTASSFGSPQSPTFSDVEEMMSFSAFLPVGSPTTKPPIPTSPKPTRVRRRPSTSSSSNTSTTSSGSERLKRKPIPVEMFLRV
ncbi:hypothetical protein E1B28_009033 [Marasmius oreades]|uniref:Uncharacterized protein n=1 Tax=Marasmius oreades TaxID=181124 RepID=A0A9P7USQ7_9AGAR|nr:uncharacterized protein E1B28_009033 [Marasmius oreades]KAG7092703.1 hypothetical protein E1B28_009033 [Marasmius oreades]